MQYVLQTARICSNAIGKASGWRPVEILFPPAEKNLGAWWTVLYAAEELGEAEFVENQMVTVLASGNKEDEYF